MDPVTVIASMAGRLAGQMLLTKLKEWRRPEVVELRKITERVLHEALTELLIGEGAASGERVDLVDRAQHVESALSPVFARKDVAERLLDAALAGTAPAFDDLVALLQDQGTDLRSLGFDLNDFLGDVTDRLRTQVVAAVKRSSSALFHHVVIGTLESRLPQVSAEERMIGLALPPPRHFVGRDADGAHLRARLIPPSDGDTPRLQVVTAVQGLPGVGKSTMAAHLAHDEEMGRAFPHGILWANLGLGAKEQTRAELARWVRALDQEPDPAWPATYLSSRLAAVLRHRRMLLIVDDVFAAAEAAPFLVGGRHCAHVVTTRQPAVAAAVASGRHQVYPLKVLTPQASFTLIELQAPEVAASHPEAVRALVERLDGLPLALNVAATLLAAHLESGLSVQSLIAALGRDAQLLSEAPPPDLAGLVDDTSPTVAAVFSRSVSVLDPVNRLRFAYLGSFDGKPRIFTLDQAAREWAAIPAPDIGTDKPRPEETVHKLVTRGLLETVGPETYRLHAVLALYARWLLGNLGNL
ncbi:NB-ARC domain-containing protein [Streptomyces sp. NPDC060028]|uniref:NB-ARC domain-containing protein n=1 Tax=Streptomyces sp. NPDC060028 TaxID=3347041 RepID=UPI0036CF7030